MIIWNPPSWGPTSTLDPGNTLSPLSKMAEVPTRTKAYPLQSLSTLQGEVLRYIQSTDAQTKLALQNPDPKVQDKLSQVNQKRSKKGKAPIDLKATTQAIQKIFIQKNLDEKTKKNKIEEIRKRLGLSKGNMKTLFTKRLGKIYKTAAQNLDRFRRKKEEILNSQIKEAEAKYGKNSDQARALLAQRSYLRGMIEPRRQEMEERSGFFNSLYPSFWSKFTGFFKKIGKGLTKIWKGVEGLLSKIPVVSQVISVVKGTVRSLKYLFKGKIIPFFKDFGTNIWGLVKNYDAWLPLIPGIGPLAASALRLIGGKIP